MPCWLFHNNGDGTFTDVSKESGIANVPGEGLGRRGRGHQQRRLHGSVRGQRHGSEFSLRQPRKGQFEEIGLLAGVGYSAYGRARSGMGVDAADYDQDGWMDLFVANVDQEMFSLYHNNKNETFSDVAMPTGIGATTRLMSGWGLKFFDYDNDGNLDLFLCNGHPDDKIDGRTDGVKYLEPMLLFRNTGKRTRRT